MKLALLVIVATCAVAGAEPVPALEQRVTAELASEGLDLPSRHLALQVEQVGRALLVSLVDTQTQRVAASTKIDQVPADPEAEVATVTHLAADLVAQASPPATSAPAAATAAALGDQQAALYQYRRQSIRFRRTWEPYEYDDAQAHNHIWHPYRGELDEDLAPVDFYHLVGRDDLARELDHRRNVAIGMYVVGGIGFAAFIAGGADAVGHGLEGPKALDLVAMGGGVLVGGVGVLLGVYYQRTQPISEAEAKTLADDFNQHLRGTLGLPTAERAPILQDVHLGLAGPGLALSGRF